MSTISFKAVFQAVEENLAFFHLMLISQAALYHGDYDPITGEDLEVAREENAKYIIHADRKEYLADDFRRNPEHYKFLLAYHALNGICHAMDWVLDPDDGDAGFTHFTELRLGEQFPNFRAIVDFISSATSLPLTSEPHLTDDVAAYVREWFKPPTGKWFKPLASKTTAHLVIRYDSNWPTSGVNVPDEEGLEIKVDFSRIRGQQTLFDYIPLRRLLLFADFCRLLCRTYANDAGTAH
ncbi:MAG TPA: hypothetical protein VKP65_21155 [Rhodothermales bacterium]|nr:hypothetical protein [Rhodothermales bacterium]